MRVAQRQQGVKACLLAVLLAACAVASQEAGAAPQLPVQAGGVLGAGGSETREVAAVEIVVKFKDDRRITAIRNTFWTDPDGARRLFEEFSRGRSELMSATLARVTYSGELVLVFPVDSDSRDGGRKAARDLAARLSCLPDIVYAEPDLTASTQTG